MKKKDLILAGGILVLALVVWLVMQFVVPKDNEKIRITVNGELYGEYFLGEDQEIEIGDTNICRIKDGKAVMIGADCPDKLCMHQQAIDAAGGTIICLPNRVVIEAVEDDSGARDGLDSIAG
ncbi:MAG: NusG domain II-containing protein [Blautia sp.]|nr:NusG domain II-containing protein [Blautia sp.]MDY3998689.1 NusG domain II-containing protein [Blautia sp.]